MPEEQNVRGNIWHRRFNRFLEVVLRWKQLGDSAQIYQTLCVRSERIEDLIRFPLTNEIPKVLSRLCWLKRKPWEI